jgi:hypothetical protein
VPSRSTVTASAHRDDSVPTPLALGESGSSKADEADEASTPVPAPGGPWVLHPENAD